jgi:chemotaxis signal transduction protein
MSSANAWLLDLGGKLQVAIGARELVQIIDAPNTFKVPLTPACSHKVMFWQKRMVPVLDLSIRINSTESKGQLLAIVGYDDAESGNARLGAIILAAPPVRIAVDDEQACSLDEHMAAWRELANASFSQNGAVIPVLHLSRLFGRASVALA